MAGRMAVVEIEDRTVPADPDVPVRIYRPHPEQGAIVRLHGGGRGSGHGSGGR
ncbi:hypothetical protein OG978_02295 [Streptomyces sp. NBC_01591]|uniref:hypothetical protein n=1 Tax=Streptomyces sp. NBC_01591 TaxID=2975888 RepID=UPI002DDA82B1|nr:hypothetical protein [Streptomyces sp. NBC_01591]WSD66342.1 hypothetical protein OG978_02295 [Streptomyces sp. NBC_01591]